MRRALRLSTPALALAPLLLLGMTDAMAGGRTVVRSPGIVQQRVVVSWDPFWYPGFGWGFYGPGYVNYVSDCYLVKKIYRSGAVRYIKVCN